MATKYAEHLFEKIRQAVMADNLARQSNGEPDPLENAMRAVPETAMWELLQWLHEVLLPGIEKSKGTDNQNYKNFAKARDCVIWSMYILQKYERNLMQLQNERMLTEMYREKAELYQSELLKYESVEQLNTHETIQAYRDAVVNRAKKILGESKAAKENKL